MVTSPVVGVHTICCWQDRDWLLLLGSGIHGEGGALLLYRSKSLSSGPPSMRHDLILSRAMLAANVFHVPTCALLTQPAISGRKSHCTAGWEYVGPLCVGKQTPGEEHDTGAMWECPFFVPLPAHASSGEAGPMSQPLQCDGNRPFSSVLNT
jgi:hypothetical protein